TTMPTPPSRSTQGATGVLALTELELMTLITAAMGPTALATSLEPWAKAMEQAVKTMRIANTRSTLANRFLASAALSWVTRLRKNTPTMVTRIATAMAIRLLSKKLKRMPDSLKTWVSPFRMVTIEIRKPTANI